MFDQELYENSYDIFFNPFVPNGPFLYPYDFLMFSVGKEGWIGNMLVNSLLARSYVINEQVIETNKLQILPRLNHGKLNIRPYPR